MVSRCNASQVSPRRVADRTSSRTVEVLLAGHGVSGLEICDINTLTVALFRECAVLLGMDKGRQAVRLAVCGSEKLKRGMPFFGRPCVPWRQPIRSHRILLRASSHAKAFLASFVAQTLAFAAARNSNSSRLHSRIEELPRTTPTELPSRARAYRQTPAVLGAIFLG